MSTGICLWIWRFVLPCSKKSMLLLDASALLFRFICFLCCISLDFYFGVSGIQFELKQLVSPQLVFSFNEAVLLLLYALFLLRRLIQASLYADGLRKGVIPTAAAIKWVLKDGIGYISVKSFCPNMDDILMFIVKVGGLVGTPDPRCKLHGYMDGDDVGCPYLSLFGWETEPIWTYLIVYFIYLALFMLNNLICWAEPNSEMF